MSSTSPKADESQSSSFKLSDKTNELAKRSDDEPSADIAISSVKPKILTTDAEYEFELCSTSSLAQLQRPMAVYRQALVDYYLVDASKSGHSKKLTDKLNIVRFLRDSAENVLHIAEQEGLKNSGLYRQVDKVHKCSRGHAYYLSGDRRNNNQAKSDSSGGNHNLEVGRKQGSGDHRIQFASTKRGRSDYEDRSYHDSAVYDDRQHGKAASDPNPGREYRTRYHGTRRYLHMQDDTMTATRDGHDYHPLDDANIFDDHETIVDRGTYRDISSDHIQVYPRQDNPSEKRGREYLDSWRPQN